MGSLYEELLIAHGFARDKLVLQYILHTFYIVTLLFQFLGRQLPCQLLLGYEFLFCSRWILLVIKLNPTC